MNKESIVYTVGGVMFILLMFWLIKPGADMSPNQVTVNDNQLAKEAVTFISPQTGESLSVTFNDETAVLSSETYADLEMVQVEAASGAKYADAETGVTLWNKGEEVSVYEDDVVTFVGQTKDSMGNPNPAGTDVLAQALTSQPWLWEKTVMNDDTVIVPKKTDAFKLTFDGSGRVSATTDCNGFGGSYSVTDGVLSMGKFMMTMMYCEGSQEMEFQQMLSEQVTLMFTDTGELVLMLPLDSGSVIFTPVL